MAGDDELTLDSLVWSEPLEDSRHRFESASPFPYLVLDNVFPDHVLTDILQDYQNVDEENWRVFNTPLQSKRNTIFNPKLPDKAKKYFDFVNSVDFLRFLSDLTGTPLLVPDPYLYGGGLHEVGPGGRFDIHVDFQAHPFTTMRNRLVLITYLNPEWVEGDGGELEFWRMEAASSAIQIKPEFGRSVLMSQSEIAAHGYPNPVKAGKIRRALVSYYYTAPEVGQTPAMTTTYLGYRGQKSMARIQMNLRAMLPAVLTRALLSFYRGVRRK